MTKNTLTVAHWMTNFAHPVSSMDDWLAIFREALETAKESEADIFLAPEHLGEHWMHFCPENIKKTDEVAWMAEQAKTMLPALQDMAKEFGMMIVAGSTTWKTDDEYHNRAWMLFPDRDPLFHDKLVLTPDEKDKNDWCMTPGDTFTTVTWRGFKLACVICLDIEMPSLSNRIANEGVDLLLVPSMTEKASGYHRVFGCAKARAVELMAPIAVVGCVGAAMKNGAYRENYSSGASVYVPCEELYGYNGIYSDFPMHTTAEGIGNVLISTDIPVGDIRDTRNGKPEVWPGPWSAAHVKIVNK